MRASTLARRLLTAVAAILGCSGDSTAPSDPVPPGSSIAVGDTIHFDFEPGDTLARFTFHSTTNQIVALFGRSESGTVLVWALDSASDEALDQVFIIKDPDPSHLAAHRTERIPVVAGQGLHFDIRPAQGEHPGRIDLWLYRVNPAPELLPAAVSPGDTITGETLENSADMDEFIMSGASSETHIGYLNTPGGFPSGYLRMRATNLAGDALGAEAANGNVAEELEGRPTARFEVPGSDGYRVTMYGLASTFDGSPTVALPYGFLFRVVNFAPESVPAVRPAGDTLAGENIDFVGDVDQFQVPLVAGAYYNIFLQTMPSADPATLRLEYSIGGVGGSVTSTVSDTVLRGQFSGLFTSPASGSLSLRVVGVSDLDGFDRGAYRIFVYPIDTLPELVPATIAPGDSAVGETIEYPGDIDKFVVTGSYDTLNVALRRSNASPEWVDVLSRNNDAQVVTHCYLLDGAPERTCTTGTFVGEVSGAPIEVLSLLGGTTGFVGGYTLIAYSLTGAAEGSNPMLTPGVAGTGVVDPPGDFDHFWFTYQRGTPIDILLSGGGSNSDNWFIAQVADSAGVGLGAFTVSGIPTGRFMLPASGTYRVEVAGSHAGSNPEEVGPYSLLLRAVSTLPETASPVIEVNDSIASEALDSLGDIDDFTLTAAPGTEVAAVVSPWLASPEAWVPGDSVPLAVGGYGTSGRVIVPAGGQVNFRIAEPRPLLNGYLYMAFHLTGQYGLVVHQINRAPESVSATVTVGVEVSGENIDVVGDVDEFTIAGSQGQSISVALNNNQSFGALRVQLEVIDPVTDEVLGSIATTFQSPITTQPIVLPVSRDYLIRIQSTEEMHGPGGYRFTVQ
jgi:hypothetical protein